jgi:AraC family transcriptional regulator
MSIAAKAAWIIERNSGRSLNLNSIAEACGVSRSHLAHAFAAATGRSVIAYLRARRLSLAAQLLADGAPDILQMALEAGYGSHEAFTRAFGDQFGVTPEKVRAMGSSEGLALQPAINLEGRWKAPTPPARILAEDRIRLVGMVGHFPGGPSTEGIAQLWQRFQPFMSAIPAIKPGMPIGVTRDTSEEGGFDYIAGLEVTRFGDLPKELEALEIGPRGYVVFTHAGFIGRIRETYRAIWDEALPATGRAYADGGCTLERHLPAFDPRTGEGGVEIWIPLE